MLTDGDLVMGHLDMDAQCQQRAGDVAAHALSLVTGREVEVAADIVGTRLTTVLEEEELSSGPVL